MSYKTLVNMSGTKKILWNKATITPVTPPPPPPVSYNCVNGVCIDPGTGYGTYSTLQACLTSGCGAPPPVSYNCVNGACVDPNTGLGTFSTLAACLASGCGVPPPNYINIICVTYTVQTLDYYTGLSMDIYKENCTVDTNRPVIICLHPGGKTKTEFTTVKTAKAFASRGYLAIAANYGDDGGGSGITTAKICNAAAIKRYVMANAVALGVNPLNVFFWGLSLGGVTSSELGILAKEIDAGNPAYYNIINLQNAGFSSRPTATATLAGASRASTRLKIDNTCPPSYHNHGTIDCTVAYSKTQCPTATSGDLETYNDELAAGIASTFNPYLNGTHPNIGSHLDNILVGGDLTLVGIVLNAVYANNIPNFTTDIGIVRKFSALIVP